MRVVSAPKRQSESPLLGAMRVYHYTTICRIHTPQYLEALKQECVQAFNRHIVKGWRKEFFALPEIQQLPAGPKIGVRLKDKQRQKFYDVERNIWQRVGSKRGDCRMLIVKASEGAAAQDN